MRTVAFFNNKGGVGKTSLVYHLAWKFADMGVHALAVDLDPQANLTAMFLHESRLEHLWPDGDHPDTVYGAIQPILRGTGDVSQPHVARISERLGLVPGDLGLSRFEDKLSDSWPRCQLRDESAFRTMTAFHRLIHAGAGQDTQLVLIDVGPNLGAINRAALIASDHVCIPLAPDLFSLQGLKNLGPALREWRELWADLLGKAPVGLSIPRGSMAPLGYIVMQHSIVRDAPVNAYVRWKNRIPGVYQEAVSGSLSDSHTLPGDPNCLALLKHYRSLMPMAMEARKPIFHLKSADGAIGSHLDAVRSCSQDFDALAKAIAAKAGMGLP